MNPDGVFINITTMVAATVRWGGDFPSLGNQELQGWMTRLAARWGDDYPSLPYQTTAPIPSGVPNEKLKQRRWDK